MPAQGGEPTALAQAIQYVLERHPRLRSDGEAVLSRLDKNDEAEGAMDAIIRRAVLLPENTDGRAAGAPHNVALRVVLTCIEAHAVRRDFTRIIDSENEAASRLDHYGAAVRDLRLFLDEIEAPAVSPMAARISMHDFGDLRHALDQIEQLVEIRGMVAMETRPRIGGTRKWRLNEAATTAAIRYLGLGITEIAGVPCNTAVTVLAGILFDNEDDSLGNISDITLDRVKGARRARKDRS